MATSTKGKTTKPRVKKTKSIAEREEEHYEYLCSLYEGIPSNKRKLVEGLLREAARLKVSLDDLWEDIKTHGNVDLDDKGREMERPASAIFTTRDKSYRACIAKLDDLLPAKKDQPTGFLSKLDDEDEEE